MTLQGKPGGRAKLPHWPTDSSDFDKHRKIHYSEGKFLKAPRNLPLANKDESSGASASISSGNQSVMMDKGWAGRLTTGVKNETVLVTPCPRHQRLMAETSGLKRL